ncbi:hypothetical protein C0992_007224 [Termitomyces sp. T32_za158]|nr:hypothetical protein C0992_007224 [Termitomyces sp. T32_za158]
MDMVVVPTTGKEETVETIVDLQVVTQNNQDLGVHKVHVLNAGLRSLHIKRLGHGVCCYGGNDMDQEGIFVLHKFIDGEARNWFRRHVLHTNRDKSYWTFKEVLIGLYNHFVNAVTMQEACEAFRTAVYDARTGIQTFYDDLVGHAQNIAVYLDEFTIWETFLDGIPAEMRHALIRNDNLSPEVNTVTEFLAYAIRYEQSARTATHYDQRSSCRATGQRQPVKVETFLAKRSKMEQNHNPRFVVRRTMPAGQRPGHGQAGNGPAGRDARYGPSVGQSAPKVTRDVPPRAGLPKAAFGGGDAGYKPSGGTPRCYNFRAAHTAAVESDAESDAEADPEEPAHDNEEVPQDVEEQSVVDDAESVQIDGDEYVAVDVYDNDYYACDDEEEHMFALTKHQGDSRVCMRRVTLQKAADKLQQPQYTPQEKECLVTYVEVNGHPAWMLWDSGSTTTGITPQFAHVNAIRIHELTEPLMLQLGTVGSRAVVQFGVEVKVKTSGQLTKEYVDIANFDCYDMIIGTPFMRKNKVSLNFVNNKVIVNGTPLRAERVVLADTDGRLRQYQATEKRREDRN